MCVRLALYASSCQKSADVVPVILAICVWAAKPAHEYASVTTVKLAIYSWMNVNVAAFMNFE